MNSESQDAMVPDYEDKKRDFIRYYEENKNKFEAARLSISRLIEIVLRGEIDTKPKVLSRVKDRSECIAKFDRKYRTDIENRKIDYNIQEYISDVVGVRVICLYESEITSVLDLIRREFYILKEENKSTVLYESVKFGYKGYHIDLMVGSRRSDLPEYKPFSDMRIEVQVRSIVQDAWSEVDHRIKYKKSVPDEIKRRIIRLAAIFELAEQEFEEIRRDTERLEKMASSAPSDLDGQGANLSTGDVLDSFSFLNFVSNRYRGYNFEPIKVDGFVDEINRLDPAMTLNKFRRIFNEEFDMTHEYRKDQRGYGININPFTHMRHMLFLAEPGTFTDMLYPGQRASFLEWVESNSAVGDNILQDGLRGIG